MWIKSKEELKSLPVFIKNFSITKPIKSCKINITSMGIFELNFNGHIIDDYFMPGWTNYNKVFNLCEYDLTDFIKNNNTISVTVAKGWFAGHVGYYGNHVWGTQVALYADILVEYKDGEKVSFSTDESWKIKESNIIDSEFFDGEYIDYTFNSEKLFDVETFECNTKLQKYDYEPVKEIDRIKPVIIEKTKSNIKLDFNQNFAGVITFNVSGKKGTKIEVRHAEVLNEDKSLYVENLRKAKSVDTIILSDEKISFSPRLTFHGFRYAEIVIDGDAKITDIEGIVLSEKIDYNGSFNCSNKIMNKIFQNVMWGQKSNFISIPTDCPQRDERLGWTGDAEVFCNTAMFNADCNRFFKNYLDLIRADILPDGRVPSLIPFFIDPNVSVPGICGWADVIYVLPYFHYLHYKNKDVIKDNLQSAVGLFNFYNSKATNYVIDTQNHLGDWLCVNEITEPKVINQCFYSLSAKFIAKFYEILGDNTNRNKYLDLYSKIRKAFRDTYFSNGKIFNDTQTIYAFALFCGLVSGDEIKESFVESINRNNNRLTTGFIGVKYLLPALCDIGEIDLAYKIAKETKYPSWGYTIENGATTIWERWNAYTKENGFETPKMNSFNHYSLGSCGEWFYSYVLGIKLSMDTNEIVISPAFSKELEFAEGNYKSVDGNIYVKWQYNGKNFELTVKADKDVQYSIKVDNKVIIK